MKKILLKIKSSVIIISSFMAIFYMGSSLVYADSSVFNGSKNSVCTGVGTGTNACGAADPNAGVNNLLKTILDTLSYVVGFGAVLMIIISGFRIIVSGGDSNSFNSAKNGIIYAVVGLVIVAIAQVIVFFVLDKTAH
ncbi:MAG: hypothetical protein WCG30_00975 [Candidatus Saccharibacteria bacterium]